MSNLNIRILGDGPVAYLLAIALAKLNVKVFLYDITNNRKVINENKSYLISQFTKTLLQKFDIWEKIIPDLYSIKSISFNDNYISKNILFDSSVCKNIGWVINHSALNNNFKVEIQKHKNILLNEIDYKDYGNDKFDLTFKTYLQEEPSIQKNNIPFFKYSRIKTCLSFNVLMRGTFKNRLYQFFKEDNAIEIIPINDKLHQVTWVTPRQNYNEKVKCDRDLLLDNLSSILPNEFNLDQIVGEIYSSNLKFFTSFQKLISKNTFYYKESSKFAEFFEGQFLSENYKFVDFVFKSIKNNKKPSKYSLGYLKFFCKSFLINIKYDFKNIILFSFSRNNIFLFIIRSLLFFLVRHFKFAKGITISEIF